MVPHNDHDRDETTRIIVLLVLVILLVMCAALRTPEAGAQKRPQPAPPRVCVTEATAQDTGYYRATIDGRPALVFARSARRPVLRVGCYAAGAFKAEWRVQR